MKEIISKTKSFLLNGCSILSMLGCAFGMLFECLLFPTDAMNIQHRYYHHVVKSLQNRIPSSKAMDTESLIEQDIHSFQSDAMEAFHELTHIK